MGVRVGDLLLVTKEERIPADSVLVSSSFENNSCFMETANLDGEKHPKPRSAVEHIKEKIKGSLMIEKDNLDRSKAELNIRAIFNVLTPNVSLYSFEGFVNVFDKEEAPKQASMSVSNFLFKGAKIANTEWAILLAIYVGKSTKIQMNGGQAKSKTTKIEKRLFIYLIILFLIQFGLSIISTLIREFIIEDSSSDFESWLKAEDTSYDVPFWLTFIRIFILLSNFIPISLVVSLECVRVVQGMFTGSNLELTSKERNMYRI